MLVSPKGNYITVQFTFATVNDEGFSIIYLFANTGEILGKWCLHKNENEEFMLRLNEDYFFVTGKERVFVYKLLSLP